MCYNGSDSINPPFSRGLRYVDRLRPRGSADGESLGKGSSSEGQSSSVDSSLSEGVVSSSQDEVRRNVSWAAAT